MGEDNLNSFHKWKNFEVILDQYEILVYPRIAEKCENSFSGHAKIQLVKAPIVEISSTFIRENIQRGTNVRPLLPEYVWQYIDNNNFYKK